jgi:two-component system sensor kinase FixL
VTNALDAMDALPVGQRRLMLTAQRADRDRVELAVGDTGRGIPADPLSTVFKPFWTTRREWLGMGLTLSKMLVEAHGGRIWAENNAAGGATFHFTLAAATAERGVAA